MALTLTPFSFSFKAASSSSFSCVVAPPPPPPPLRIHRPCRCCANSALTNIQNSGVVACLRAQSPHIAMEAARAAITAGVTVLEIVISTPGCFEVLHQLVQDYPTTTLGVGTVLKTEDAKNAMNAGAKFIMSPATVKGILDQYSELLYIPGVMTPTEILSAYDAGAKIVKVYPVSVVGGVGYIKTLKKPFPHIPMVASQGITIDSVGDYIGHGASSVVLSDAIFDKEAMAQRNFTAIYRLARHAVAQAHQALKRKKKVSPL